MKKCTGCDKLTENYINWCSWECNIAHAKANGGVVHTPNGLPITTIKHDGTMMEHEHADHPDYKFPVTIEYVGKQDPRKFFWGEQDVTDIMVEMCKLQDHALIYTDGTIAVTLYECCYAMWTLHDGKFHGGSLWKKDCWRMSRDSIEKIGKLICQ